MDFYNINNIPVFLVPIKIDTDVVTAMSLWLLMNYKDTQEARKVLEAAEVKVVNLQYKHYEKKDHIQWPGRPVLVFDVGRQYLPGKVFDHHQCGGAPSAASLVWDEYKDKEMDYDLRQACERLITFVNDTDNYHSFFDSGQMILEKIVELLKLTNVSILNNSANGPTHLPNFLAKLIKRQPERLSSEKAKEILLHGFGKICEWLEEEKQIRILSENHEIRPVSNLIDVISLHSTLLPDRLRFLYNRLYRLQLKKFYILAAVVEYPYHRQLVVQKLIPGALATINLKSLATWLVHKFGFQYSEIKVLKNNNVLSVKIPHDMTDFYLQPVADWLKYNVKLREDFKLSTLTKFFTTFFSFWEFHESNEIFLKEAIALFNRLLRVLQSVEDLEFLRLSLDKMEVNAQIRSDSYPRLPCLNEEIDYDNREFEDNCVEEELEKIFEHTLNPYEY